MTSTRRALRGGCLLAALLISACSEPECSWSVDDLLAEAQVSAGARKNCGLFWATEGPQRGFDCFSAERAQSRAVEFTYNECIDCSSMTTYLSLANGEQYAVSREDDHYGGDNRREARVLRCDAIEPTSTRAVACSNGRELHQCSAPRGGAPKEPAPIPVAPRKVQDLPSGGAATTTLHLYVSNQSFERPLVDIGVFINDQRVVIGDFAVEGQHTWHQFDIEVPVGTLSISALSFRAQKNAATGLSQSVHLVQERWAVLSFWSDPQARFTWTLHDGPVAFD